MLLNFFRYLLLITLAVNRGAYAVAPAVRSPTGVGAVANNLFEPVTLAANFVGSASMAIGLSFVFAAFLKYMQHRVNPYAVPISTPILLLGMGIILVILPWTYKLTSSGIPMHF